MGEDDNQCYVTIMFDSVIHETIKSISTFHALTVFVTYNWFTV